MRPAFDQNATKPSLADLRGRAVLSQEGLADISGLTQETISQLETGKVENPRPATIRALAEALRLTPQEVAAACVESRRRAVVATGEHTPSDATPTGSVKAEPDTRRTTRIVASPEAGS